MKYLNISSLLLLSLLCSLILSIGSIAIATPALSEIAKERSELEILSQEINTLQKKKNQEIDFLLEKKTELMTEQEALKLINQDTKRKKKGETM